MQEQKRMLQNRYALERRQGAGGFGEVWRAWDSRVKGAVAIKQVRLTGSREARQRFEREGELLGKLKHPHVIELSDRFEEDGSIWLVMPFADGGSLSDLMQRPQYRHGMPVEDVVTIGRSLAGALRSAHRQGVIHRDVKPGNVLLVQSTDGLVVKLADFGVATLAEGHGEVTRTGEPAGTLAFLSPEQLRGYPATPASDIHALGAVLYRLLTNRHYVTLEGDEVEKRRLIVEGEVFPLSAVRDDVPEWLATLIGRMLEKSPQKRPDSASVCDALARAGADASPAPAATIYHTGTVSPDAARRLLWKGAMGRLWLWLLVSVLLGGVAGTWLSFAPGVQLPEWVEQSSLNRGVQAVVAWLTGGRPDEEENPPLQPGQFSVSEPVYAVVVNTAPARGLRLRDAPGLDGKIVTLLPEGTVVRVLAFRDYNEWALIALGDSEQEGWVFGAYLRILPGITAGG